MLTLRQFLKDKEDSRTSNRSPKTTSHSSGNRCDQIRSLNCCISTVIPHSKQRIFHPFEERKFLKAETTLKTNPPTPHDDVIQIPEVNQNSVAKTTSTPRFKLQINLAINLTCCWFRVSFVICQTRFWLALLTNDKMPSN